MKQRIFNITQKGKYLTTEIDDILRRSPKSILHKMTGAGLTHGRLNDKTKSHIIITPTRKQVENKKADKSITNLNALFIYEDSNDRWSSSDATRKSAKGILKTGGNVTVYTTFANFALLINGRKDLEEQDRELYQLISEQCILIIDEFQELFSREYHSTQKRNVSGQNVFNAVMQAARDFKRVMFASASGLTPMHTAPINSFPIYKVFPEGYTKPHIGIRSFDSSKHLKVRLFEEIQKCIAIDKDGDIIFDRYDLLVFYDNTEFIAVNDLNEVAVACGTQMRSNLALMKDITPLMDGGEQKGFTIKRANGKRNAVHIGSKSVIAGVDFKGDRPVKIIVVSELIQNNSAEHLLKDAFDVYQGIGRVRSRNFFTMPEVWEYHSLATQHAVMKAKECEQWNDDQSKNKDISRINILSNYVLHRRRSAPITIPAPGEIGTVSDAWLPDVTVVYHINETPEGAYKNVLEDAVKAAQNDREKLPEALERLYHQRNAIEFQEQHRAMFSRWQQIQGNKRILLLIQAVLFSRLEYTPDQILDESEGKFSGVIKVVDSELLAYRKINTSAHSFIEQKVKVLKTRKAETVEELTLNARESGVFEMERDDKTYLSMNNDQQTFILLLLLRIAILQKVYRNDVRVHNTVNKITAGKDVKGTLAEFMKKHKIKDKEQAKKELAKDLRFKWEYGLEDLAKQLIGLFGDLNIKEGREYTRFASLNRELRAVVKDVLGMQEIDGKTFVPAVLKNYLLNQGFTTDDIGILNAEDVYLQSASIKLKKPPSKVSKKQRELEKRGINSVLNWHEGTVKISTWKRELSKRLHLSERAVNHIVEKFSKKGEWAKTANKIEEQAINKLQSYFDCPTVRLHDGLYILPIAGALNGSVEELSRIEVGESSFIFETSNGWEQFMKAFDEPVRKEKKKNRSVWDSNERARREFILTSSQRYSPYAADYINQKVDDIPF